MHGAYDQMYKRSTEQRIVEDHVELCSRLCSKLPRNLRYPTEKTQPWVKWSFDDDFVLLAEFSEDEGPRPVLTIPKNGAGTFDVNHFAVHVMSVDYQSQGTSRGGPFSIVEDTQVFLTERREKVYVYVHHFTLYDIHARGFVRPFCMCYISHSKRKVLSCLDQLMEEFSKVSKLFRLGNKIVFSQDLEQKLTDIYSLKGENVISWCNSRTQADEDDRKKRKTKENHEQVLQETRKIVEVLKPHMNDSKIIYHFQQLESVATKRERSSTCSVRQAEGPKVYCPDSGFSLQKSHSLPNLADAGKTRKHHRQTRFSPSYLHKLDQLRNLYELCELGAKEGLNRLRTIYKHFSQDEVALSIEATEAGLIDPLSSLLTVGKSVVHNFLHKVNLGTIPKQVYKNVYEQDHGTNCLHSKLSGSLYSLDSFHSCVEEDIIGSARSSDGDLSPFTAAIAFHMELQGGDISDIEKQSLSSAAESEKRLSDDGSHSLSLNDFDIIDEKNERLYLNENPNLLRRTSVNDSLSSVYKRNSSLLLRKSLSADNLTASLYSERSNSSHEEQTQQFQQSNVLRPFFVREGSLEITNHKCCYGKGDGSQNEGSSQELCKRRWKSDNCSKKPQSAISQDVCVVGKSCRRIQGHGRQEKVFLRCYAEEVCTADEKIFAGDILQFRNNYSFGVHLIAALLSGRPMVILADPQNEKNVRTLVSTLWTFVPEKLSHHLSVVPWRKKPLHVSDLSWLKIVGLARNKHCNMLPKAVMQYISVLDYETGNIITPPYKGVFLNSIFNSRSNWPTNASFVAYIHSVFLELASKAYVYYYKFCLRSLCWFDRDGVVSSAKTLQARSLTDTTDILSRLGMHFSDAKIVQYFAELIKLQQVNQHFSCLQQDQDFCIADNVVIPDASLPIDVRNSLPPTIIADLSKSQKFKNLKTADL